MVKLSDNTFYGINIKKNATLIIVGLFIILVIIKSFLSLFFCMPFLSDERVYDNEAKILSSGKLYPHMGQQPPVYIFFQSIAYILSGNTSIAYHIMLITGCIFSSTIIFPAYLILKKYIDLQYAILGAIAISTCLALNYFSFTLMQENLYIPLILFSILFLIEAFETNRLGWQILAGISIVFLEMTKSIGQIAEIAFLATILIYILMNREQGIINILKSKTVLLVSFLLSFSVWHIFLSNVDYINAILTGGGGKTYIGTTYNVEKITNKAIFSINNIEDYLRLIQTLFGHIDYMLLASLMVFSVILFFYFTKLNNKVCLGKGFKICETFISQFALFSIIGVTVITLGLRSMGDNSTTIGRYIEPAVPPIILLGLIYICNLKSEDFKRYVNTFIVFSIIISIFFIVTNNTPINMFSVNATINNPSLSFFYYIEILGLLPYSLILFVILPLTVFYLSMTDKKFITVLIILMIMSSILISVIPYLINLKCSNNMVLISKGQFPLNNKTVLSIDNSSEKKNVNNSTITTLTNTSIGSV